MEDKTNFDVVNERYVLSQALLKAMASIARNTEPEIVLQAICDSIITSQRIKLAWIAMGELEPDAISPEYCVGPAVKYANDFSQQPRTAAEIRTLTSALKSWNTSTYDILEQEAAYASGLRSVISLPVGQKNGLLAGVIMLYSDMPAYFELVGTSFFSAFIHLANSSLEQCTLLNELTHLASHDLLTGILNRRGIQECMERELSRSIRKDQAFSIVLFDVDRFKLVNDLLGHKEGDSVLKAVADAVEQIMRIEDYFGRWGGEEFICVMPESNHANAMQIAERMRQHIKSTQIQSASSTLNVTASFGVASYPEDGKNIDKLIASADAALYHAKRTGRNRVISANAIEQDIYTIGNELNTAIRENRIIPAYQKIIDLQTGQLVGEETFARLITPGGNLIHADQFIDAAHQLQLLHKVDRNIILQTFAHCVANLRAGNTGINNFINISADLLRHRELVDEMLTTIMKHCHSCQGMVIKITERELLTDINAVMDLLSPFIDFGFKLALDDFGSGYSSYKYLADLPIHFIKIDGELIKRINEPKVHAIVKGIQDTANRLEITTLAEYIENDTTEAILKDIGINWGQGYYYGKPEVLKH
ncbi:MAG: bifunctional diguanylate cyclase/phosphodiesterase [Gammaproteobacteria bacterium]|nr:bifunctional diguanylate cyclase/phosphodiesterase [Gammaproteobacteria bacterium]